MYRERRSQFTFFDGKDRSLLRCIEKLLKAATSFKFYIALLGIIKSIFLSQGEKIQSIFSVKDSGNYRILVTSISELFYLSLFKETCEV